MNKKINTSAKLITWSNKNEAPREERAMLKAIELTLEDINREFKGVRMVEELKPTINNHIQMSSSELELTGNTFQLRLKDKETNTVYLTIELAN